MITSVPKEIKHGDVVLVACKCEKFGYSLKSHRSHYHCSYCSICKLKCDMAKHIRTCKQLPTMNNVSKEDSQGYTVKLHKNKSLNNGYKNEMFKEKRGITIENIEYCNIILNEEGINLNDTIFSKTSTRKDIGKTDNKATFKDSEIVSINNDNCFKMQLPKECKIIFPQCKWESLKTDICLKNERKILPKQIKKIKDFSCCVKFIRHFVSR